MTATTRTPQSTDSLLRFGVMTPARALVYHKTL